MIEQGINLLIQAGVPNVPGGFAFGQLPINQISASAPKAWSYRSVSSLPTYVLEGQISLTHWTIQIDSYGYTANDSITLSRAIDGVLRGSYRGTLTDPDSTIVNGIFRLAGLVDGFDDTNRSYVRSVDYLIAYYQQ
jgi:hypothetical protein